MLDQFLKSARFFESARFPTATFKSNSFTFSGEQLVSVSGDLNLHGITKRVVLDVVYVLGNDSDEVKVDLAVAAPKAQRP
jgi:polyisoprenoid-binding protein YceI